MNNIRKAGIGALAALVMYVGACCTYSKKQEEPIKMSGYEIRLADNEEKNRVISNWFLGSLRTHADSTGKSIEQVLSGVDTNDNHIIEPSEKDLYLNNQKALRLKMYNKN